MAKDGSRAGSNGSAQLVGCCGGCGVNKKARLVVRDETAQDRTCTRMGVFDDEDVKSNKKIRGIPAVLG